MPILADALWEQYIAEVGDMHMGRQCLVHCCLIFNL